MPFHCLSYCVILQIAIIVIQINKCPLSPKIVKYITIIVNFLYRDINLDIALRDNMQEKDIHKVLKFQKNEITEYIIYAKLGTQATGKNSEILKKISQDELMHYNILKEITKIDVKPSGPKIFVYYLIARLLGLSFGLRFMEAGEKKVQESYMKIKNLSPKLKSVIKDEEEHEAKLLSMIESTELQYSGSIILGLNDALVELTGALAGLTFALNNTKIIAAVGMITGIAASLSMAASEYLSSKEEQKKSPLRASVYTGFAYIIAVILLIMPYLILNNPYLSLAVTLLIGILIIFVFNVYVSVARNTPFRNKFLKMVAISLSVAAINFVIGIIVKKFFLD